MLEERCVSAVMMGVSGIVHRAPSLSVRERERDGCVVMTAVGVKAIGASIEDVWRWAAEEGWGGEKRAIGSSFSEACSSSVEMTSIEAAESSLSTVAVTVSSTTDAADTAATSTVS